ncbi:unnamed protein product [Brugia pahangi]|uniref:Aldedh domain-containing protein n=1 Tax=Brugia pahangi TaxID=6280 RepID=A0A0N4TXX7_BRUPA|nr:unnamed protein product [Brugia pahangi]
MGSVFENCCPFECTQQTGHRPDLPAIIARGEAVSILREYSASEEAFTKVAIERKKEVVGDLKEAMIKKDKTPINFLIGKRDTYVSRDICVHVDIIITSGPINMEAIGEHGTLSLN